MEEIRLLKAEEIECRIGTISSKGCSLLLYKDARVDMRILDETYGVGRWQRYHEVINNNLFCTIEIWNDEIKQWVKKQDVGTESYSEKEKGEASDSFKRAGFNVGIGRELYTSPFIWILPKNKEMGTKIKIKDEKTGEVKEELKEFYVNAKGKYETKTRFKVKEIGYNESREINKIVIVDNKGHIRFEMIPQDEQKEKLENMDMTEAQRQQLLSKYENNLDKLQEEVCARGKMKLRELTFQEAEEILEL